jgi:hypothetical protein
MEIVPKNHPTEESVPSSYTILVQQPHNYHHLRHYLLQLGRNDLTKTTQLTTNQDRRNITISRATLNNTTWGTHGHTEGATMELDRKA